MISEIEAEVKRIGEEVTTSLKRILPASFSSDNNEDDKTQQTITTTTDRMMAPRHSMPALRHSMIDLKRWSLGSASIAEGVGIGLDTLDSFVTPLQRLFEQDRVSFLPVH